MCSRAEDYSHGGEDYPSVSMADSHQTHEYSSPEHTYDTYDTYTEDELEYEHSEGLEAGRLLKNYHHGGHDQETWRSSRGAEAIRKICSGMVGVVFTVMILLSLAQIVHLLVGFSAAVWAGDIQNYLTKFDGSDEQWYPTSFTRDIVPKPIHSHNDYWRKVPLFDAISVGCISVEADVWHFDGDDELYIGHDQSSLTKNRTLNSLFINPLLDILHRQNPETEFAHNTYNGVFDTDPSQTLYLYIDVKTSGVPTWASVLTHLTPLHPYLTYYNTTTGTTHYGPVTIHMTGNSPFAQIAAPPPPSENHARYAFYDAPVSELTSPNSPYNTTNSLMSSGEFSAVVPGRIGVLGDLSTSQMDKLKAVIKGAHDKGIGVRFWETPAWPVRRRYGVWRALVEAGVDLLNADDIWGAAGMNW